MLVLPLNSRFLLIKPKCLVLWSWLVDDCKRAHLRVEISVAQEELFILNLHICIFLDCCVNELAYNSNLKFWRQVPS